MSITTSINGITDFLQKNESLIKDIADQAKSIKDLYDQLSAHSSDAKKLLDDLPKDLPFAVSDDAAVSATQSKLLAEIEETSKKITDWHDQPMLTASLYMQRAALYQALGNTYNSLVAKIVHFSPSEIDDLRVLLRRAELDAAARQRWADVLDAAIQLSKFAFGIAEKLTALG